MSGFKTTNWYQELAAGRVLNNVNVSKPSYNVSLPGSGTETIWSYSVGQWVKQIVSSTYTVTCSSAADTGAGTGARTVSFTYVDGSYDRKTATVTLNGVTPVITTFSGLGINDVRVLTAGTGLTNSGTITITSTTEATVQAFIAIGESDLQQSIYHVPNGYNLFIKRTKIAIFRTAAVTVSVRGYMVNAGVKHLIYSNKLDDTMTAVSDDVQDIPILIPQNSYIYFEADSSAANAELRIYIQQSLETI